jgi:hypothetical protein
MVYRWCRTPPEGPVGAGKFVLFRGGFARATGRKPGLFRAFDLRDTPVVNDELDNAVAQAFNFFADQRDPIGRGSDEGGR